ncbi:Copper resistance protein D [Paraburkholderia piptadeniae]|uniref:Copper resistance protein D n=1 Tax=Paraburkholderia piptadeniae TaxID=1701573 RepID=A0A1N7SVA6_9BURK|nr:CopD family protein [Paraburkholderia piptadeniae]SIT51273.1 Copper resistance protein D [Paraburkholderia piptadeniae]
MDAATVSASIVVAAVANVSFACAVGACLAALMLDRAPPLVRHRSQRFAAGCVVTLIVADAVNLLLEAALMSGSAPRAAFAVLVPVMTQSHFGAVWSAGFVALVVWAGLLVRTREGGWAIRMGIALVAAAVFAFSKAASSHAADAGDFALPEWIHWGHLCATATWAGLVIASGLRVLPMLREHVYSQSVAHFAGRLSATATLALAAVLMSGAYNADRGLGGSFVPLMRSDWGHILDAKLVLVGAAIVLGGINRIFYLPHVRRGGSSTAANSFLTILRVEAVAMIGVLSAAAVLAHTVPGAHPGT